MMSDICGCQNLLGAERGGRAPTPLQRRHIGPETGMTTTYIRLILLLHCKKDVLDFEKRAFFSPLFFNESFIPFGR